MALRHKNGAGPFNFVVFLYYYAETRANLPSKERGNIV
ncbi:hypothetical protein HMPREF7215_1827 [Pyramidobacter piscolens W5455]|uniref:Uncharacterized protein n=1 Tax=Pyramidobacter piscolens W5455 TaxID=352165 RepID=A0ABM9ZT89_9BACT|nr:hypothetical protein HMPREF7215_1827 [Pyramidobacter piscolens W5455]